MLSPANSDYHPATARFAAAFRELDAFGLHAVLAVAAGQLIHKSSHAAAWTVVSRIAKAIADQNPEAANPTLLGEAAKLRSHWRVILKEVAAKYQISEAELLGPHRYRSVAHPRHEVMWRMRKETPLSYPEIGRRLGDRDHTTVIHGVRKHEQRMAEALAAE